jgi:dTDP-4-amino-4,6-dideoxygalactose transaminase
MNKSPANRTKDRFLVFGAPLIGTDEIAEVHRTLESGWLGTGPKVAQFERDFHHYKGGWGTAVALNSCTAALHLSLLTLDLEPGDEVITTPLTFCATVNAIIHAGGTPVLADVDPITMNMDPAEVARKIGKRTKAIIPVHFGGRPCPMDALMALADRHGLSIIEDCAHAIESEYHGKKVGTFGDFGCFSFYVTKNIVTGEGGMALCRTEQSAARVKTLGLHGMSRDAWKRFSSEGYKHYQVVECGFKYNMMDLQAAIGIHQLRRVDQFWEARKSLWTTYNTAFAALPVGLPAPPEVGTKHGLHLYTLRIDPGQCGVRRDDFLAGMTERNIGVGVHYMSIPEHPYYRDRFGWSPDDYPHAAIIGRQTVSLPFSPKLSDEDVTDVIGAVKETLGL